MVSSHRSLAEAGSAGHTLEIRQYLVSFPTFFRMITFFKLRVFSTYLCDFSINFQRFFVSSICIFFDNTLFIYYFAWCLLLNFYIIYATFFTIVVFLILFFITFLHTVNRRFLLSFSLSVCKNCSFFSNLLVYFLRGTRSRTNDRFYKNFFHKI